MSDLVRTQIVGFLMHRLINIFCTSVSNTASLNSKSLYSQEDRMEDWHSYKILYPPKT